MPESVVVNASPLIVMAHGGCFELLRTASSSVLVPETVVNEICRRGPDDPTVKAINGSQWLTVVDDPVVPAQIQAWDLGPGESTVLAWAHSNPPAEAIIDDLPARRCAIALGIAVRGTLGLILAARQKGLIPAARPILDRMVQAGMYLSHKVLNEALVLVGE